MKRRGELVPKDTSAMDGVELSPQSRGRAQVLAAAVSAVLSLAAASIAQAQPLHGVVTRGDATIGSPHAGTTQIDQTSHSVSIDWQSFDVSAHETVNFRQPTASSVALNRILDQDPSLIQGSLNANGRVFLINPNGIIFGATSRINVGALVASSLELATADEAGGRYRFRTGVERSGAIVNQGRIVAAEGGSVTLLGGSVANDGLIVADFGSVQLGAGRAAILDFIGDGLLRFQIDEDLRAWSDQAGSAVHNTGEIQASGGQVVLTARAADELIAHAVNNEGVVRASRVQNVGGRIRLVGAGSVVNSGTLDASAVGADGVSGVGGEVHVLGDEVELSATSRIDVSGAAGGTALIGGAFRGADPSVPNAQRTQVERGSVIRADSTRGDAGKVAVWSDGTTTFEGEIYARAAGMEGDGGDVEVSGRGHLSMGGHAWLQSAYGSFGTLLLDPGSVTITNGGNSAPPASLDTFHDGWINAQLNDANLVIETANSTNDDPNQRLVVAAGAHIGWNGTTSLTLVGDDAVSVLGTITNAGTGALTLRSDAGAVAIDGNVTLAGDLNVVAGGSITQSAAIAVAGHVNLDAGGGVAQSGPDAVLDVGGNVDVTAGDAESVLLDNPGNVFDGLVRIGAASGRLDDVVLRDSTSLALQGLTLDGNLEVIAGGALTQAGALDVGGTASFTATDGTSMALDNAGNAFGGTVRLAASSGNLEHVAIASATALDLQTLDIGGNLTASAGGNISLQALTADALTLTAGGSITQSGAWSVGLGTSLTAADGASITLNAANSFDGAVSLLSVGTLQDVTIRDLGDLDLQPMSIAGNLTATSGGDLNLQALVIGGHLTVTADRISQSGALSVGGTSSFSALAGQSIVLDRSNSFGASVGFAGIGGNLQDLTLRSLGSLELRGLTLDGRLSVIAGGAITQSGALEVAGAANFKTLNAAGAAITLDGANRYGSIAASVRTLDDTANASASIVLHERDDTLLGDVRTGPGQSVSIVSGGAIAALAGTTLESSTVSLDAAGDIGASGGPVQLVTSTGRIDAVSGGSLYLTNASGVGNAVVLQHLVSGPDGSIDVTADGTIRVADVQADSSMSLTSSGGSIVSDAAAAQLVVDRLTLVAAGAIGEAAGSGHGALDVHSGAVSAHAQAGGVYLNQSDGDMRIGQIEAAGPVSLSATGGSILDDASDGTPASVASTAGGVRLSALHSIGAITDLRTRQGAPISITTNGGALGARVMSANGQINLDLAAGTGVTVAPGAISAGGSGELLMQSAGDLSLASFDGAISGFAAAAFSSDATLSWGGAQEDLIAGPLDTLVLRGAADIAGTGRSFDLGAGHLVFESGGQGGDVTLDTNVTSLDAAIGNGAGLSVVERSGEITLGSIVAGGDVSIVAAGILDDGDPGGITRVSAGGKLSLSATAGIGRADGSGGGRVDTAGDEVSISTQSGSVYLAHAGDLQIAGQVRGGSIDIVAPSGSIDVSSALRATGPLSLSAGTDATGGGPGIVGHIVVPGVVETQDALTLTALGGGTISDDGDSTPHFSAADARLTATQAGAANNRMNLDVDTLSAHTPEGLYVNAADGIAVRDIAARDVAIHAVGTISDDGDARTRIVAGSATLSGSAIGAPGSGNEIATDVDRLSATASAGGIYVDELDGMELGTLSADVGSDITVVAAGAIMDDGDDTTRISGGHVTLSGTAVGVTAAGGALDTQVSSLTAHASAGGISISEVDDLQLDEISAAAGHAVAIAAGGALTDDGDAATRVAGDEVTLVASRIGTRDARVDTAAGTLSAIATAGGIFVDELDAVTLAHVESVGTGHEIDLRTANDGSIAVQNVTTHGGTVNLAAGGRGSLNVTGVIASNGGLVNLAAGDALSVPGLSTGAGSVVLRTVNDLHIGTITAGSITITSDTGDVTLGTVDAGSGRAAITASQGAINDGADTSLIAGEATLSARAIGSVDNPLNMAVDALTATTSAGGVFIEEADALSVLGISSAGQVSVAAGGALVQHGVIVGSDSDISVSAESIAMQASAVTTSHGGDITYVARKGDITLGVLEAGIGRALVIAGDCVYSAMDAGSGVNNMTASQVEVRAGGLRDGPGEVGTTEHPLSISTPPASGRSVYVIVPTLNGVQTSTPHINYAGSPAAILLKGYSGTGGPLFFDPASAFTPDAVLGAEETIVPLLNGRIAVNSDSLSAATQALASGVVSRVNVDWAAFDPDVSLFGTLDPPLRLPADQREDETPLASLIPSGMTLALSQNGWRLVSLQAGVASLMMTMDRPAWDMLAPDE